jgi:hypothetical protein
VTDHITREDAERLIAEYEPALRFFFAPDPDAPDADASPLPPEWEKDLARCDRSTARGALSYLVKVAAYYGGAHERASAAARPDQDAAREAAHHLLARAPVPVHLSNGRTVHVTSRSTTALCEMTAHALRIRLLETQLQWCGDRFREAEEKSRSAAPRRSRAGWRRRLRALERIHRRYYAELMHQRAAMWAHALTPDGAPATAVTAPAWTAEITPEDDVLLMLALQEAGPGRVARLVAALPPQKASAPRGPDFGPDAILVNYGFRVKVRPAECRDFDLGQITAEMLVGALPPLEDED